MGKSEEKGQGLVEYAIILVVIAIILIVVVGGCALLFLGGVFTAAHWAQFIDWGTGLVAGLQRGDPQSIFVAAVIGVIILFVVVGGRRR